MYMCVWEKRKKRIYKKMLCVHLGAFTCFDVYFNQFLKNNRNKIQKIEKKININKESQ